MKHICEAGLERNLAALRAAPRPMDLADGVPVTEQVFFNWDVGGGEVQARLLPDPGALASFEAEVRGTPRWLSLSVIVGDAAFTPGEVVGLVLSARAGEPFATTPFLRTGTGHDERNSEMGEPIEIGTETGVSVRLLTIGRREAEGPARPVILILPLPQQSFRFTLVDMRLFVLPAGVVKPATLPVLGGIAV